MRSLKNQKGQSLIEYVILVALVGVASVGLVRTLQQQVRVNLANVVYGLQSKSSRAQEATINESDLRRADFTDFMNGTGRSKNHH